MTSDRDDLIRYLDGEMSRLEAERFRLRLARSAELRRGLAQMQDLGRLVRVWAKDAESRAGSSLLEPTLLRVREAQQTRARVVSSAFVAALLLALVLPWSLAPAVPGPAEVSRQIASPGSAAIERFDSGAQQASVFAVGSNATPVIWLSDDPQPTAEPGAAGPG